jgi:hypothetical protein
MRKAAPPAMAQLAPTMRLDQFLSPKLEGLLRDRPAKFSHRLFDELLDQPPADWRQLYENSVAVRH